MIFSCLSVRVICRVALALVLSAGPSLGARSRTVRGIAYPQTRKSNVVTDYHGTKVADPYRWLEDAESAETKAWVEEENRLTFSFVRSYPHWAEVKARLEQLWDYPRYGVPVKEGARYFFTKNNGLQNQPVIYVQDSPSAEPRALLDPNELSKDGTVAVTNRAFSKDGSLMAYGLSSSGSDWQEIRVRKVDEALDHPEVLRWCKFSSIAWAPDNSGFFYNRFPDPSTVAPEDRNNYNRVYWHTVGKPQSEDVLIYADSGNKELGFAPIVSEDGRYLLLYVYHGTDDRNGIYYRRLGRKETFRVLVDVGEAMFDPIDNVGPRYYFHTDLNAPRGRIISIDLDHPERSRWREIVPEGADVISSAVMAGGALVVSYLHDASSRLVVYDLDGRGLREIRLPALGTVSGLSGKKDDDELFFAFTSFLYPTTVFRYSVRKANLEVFHKPDIDFDPADYVTEQVYYRSKDGTRVPMFITHRKGIALDRTNPTLLYGYGGFNISITPYFSSSLLLWLEKGGIYAVANIRGGREYGERWHRAGMLGNKQNVFDDFIAAAEWLIEKGYTSKEKLAVTGASNGGLLVAACMVQRPDVFGAVVCRVPVIDMLRYHKFTVGRYWIPEYGNAEENPEHFKFLYAYSPLHNVRRGVAYPPTLITTADSDDRVVPAHAKKFAATLQEKDAGKNPILLRVETRAGHGRGKPTSKKIEEMADMYAFLFKVLGVGKGRP